MRSLNEQSYINPWEAVSAQELREAEGSVVAVDRNGLGIVGRAPTRRELHELMRKENAPAHSYLTEVIPRYIQNKR